MTALVSIRAALENRLLALGAFATIYQNETYEAVAAGTPFQRASMLPADPIDTFGSGSIRIELGVFHILLCFPRDAGTGAAEARADALREHFKKGTTLTNGGFTVNVTKTPRVAPGSLDGDRWCVPVSVPWQACVV